MRLAIWLKAIRAPFFTATIIPVILGSIFAWHATDDFLWFKFWLALVGAVLIHTGTNLANDYFDHISGCDEANQTPTPFSGGSRMIQEGIIPPKHILIVSVTSFLIGGAIGLYLNHISKGNVILLIGAIGIFLGVFYTAKPFRIGYGTFGELAVGIGFGPLVVLGAYYVQAQELSVNAFLISLPIGILIALVLYINEFPDYNADKSVGKNTLVVFLGKRKAVALYHILLGSVYALIVGLIIFKILPLTCFIALLTLPLGLKAFLVSKGNFDKVYEMLPANAATIALHSLIGVLLCVGIVLDKIL